jgi:hypothetical protein
MIAIVGPARPLIEQFCPTSQQIIPRAELKKIRPKFLKESEVEPERRLIRLISEVMMMKTNTVSAVMFSTP